MRKSLLSSLVLVIALILAVTPMVLAADFNASLDYMFGNADYSDSDDNGFDATLNGFQIKGSFDITDRIAVMGSYYSASSADAVPLAGIGKGDLENSKLAIAGLYNLGQGLKIGAGWVKFGFEVAGEGYSANRDYSGLELVGSYKMNFGSGLGVDATVGFAPSLSVTDKVKGDVGDPDRTAEASYKGSLLGFEIGATYAISENINIKAGYRSTRISGDGKPDHPEYRFLSHDYTVSGFFLGVGAAF